MAKTAITVTAGKALSETDAGSAPISATAARGSGATGRPHVFPNNGRTILRFTNSNQSAAATPAYVTVRSRAKSNQGFYNHAVVLVPKNTSRVAGPFPPGRFGGEVELYFTSDDPDERIAGDGNNGFKETGTLADLGTELSPQQAAELSIEAIST